MTWGLKQNSHFAHEFGDFFVFYRLLRVRENFFNDG
jgi:hypothetical protein